MSLMEQFNIWGKYDLCSCQELDKKICNYKETIPSKTQRVIFTLVFLQTKQTHLTHALYKMHA